MDTKKKIGLYFGTFNPIHSGHLMIANFVHDHTEINQVWFVVSPHNPFKDKNSLLQDSERLTLVKIAIQGSELLQVCDVEFQLPQPSYTINTIEHLIKNYSEYEFSIIMGADNLSCFDQWKGYSHILENHKIYVYPRMNASKSSIQSHKNIYLIEAPIHKISSSQIRVALKNGQKIDEIVPKEVIDRIHEMNYFTD